MCKRDFYIRTLIIKTVFDKISNFQEIAPIFTYSHKKMIFKYN